ncbi:sll0787 family AIR synthase-like protein [Ancylobacter defluvii]|uniref:Methanogenesis marker 2 protein n=1 Tax=Ancylobacter defluvii TaxID=1282440 RepID=A0A9W6K108_9HYPH|nr:sll0787 family AIR synthase-like protein [Ancylobacter defluvii]MBS7586708.1 sll0787 family AIR synthase-like protein [Ancylobacter defluvii]GLK86009.1 methanogenesis marker 2 protein [Ancylobacter defluvii]
MDASAFATLVDELRANAGLAAKAEIGDVAARLGLSGARVPVGDDCAAIPDGDGHLLFAIEGFINGFVAADPWFAGWCGVMVNLSDIAAMGGRPLAVVDAVWAKDADNAAAVLDGMRAASEAYGVPIVGGHSNLHTTQEQLAVAVLGRAGKCLLTSFDARPGEVLIAAIDQRGGWREPFDNWQAALAVPPERLRADLALLPEIAERGLSRAAKDISQAGLVGTAVMLAECSDVAIDIDLDAIPLPQGVELARWLRSFPSFGFLLTAAPEEADAVLALFAARDIAAAAIGTVSAGHAVSVASGPHRALIRDYAAERLMGLGAKQEEMA